jgi:hypothetical protein
MKRPLLFVALMLMLSGCSTTHLDYRDGPRALYKKWFTDTVILAYVGEVKPFDEVGVFTKDHFIRIYSINGIKEKEYLKNYRKYKSSGLRGEGRYQLHMKPGTYIFEIGIFSSDASHRISSTSNITETIEIKKGQVIHLSMNKKGRYWSVKKTNGLTGLDEMKKDFSHLVK